MMLVKQYVQLKKNIFVFFTECNKTNVFWNLRKSNIAFCYENRCLINTVMQDQVIKWKPKVEAFTHAPLLFRNYRPTDWQTIDLFKTSKPEKASHDPRDLVFLRSWGNLEQFLL